MMYCFTSLLLHFCNGIIVAKIYYYNFKYLYNILYLWQFVINIFFRNSFFFHRISQYILRYTQYNTDYKYYNIFIKYYSWWQSLYCLCMTDWNGIQYYPSDQFNFDSELHENISRIFIQWKIKHFYLKFIKIN